MYKHFSYKLLVDTLLSVHSEVMKVWEGKKESLKRKNWFLHVKTSLSKISFMFAPVL